MAEHIGEKHPITHPINSLVHTFVAGVVPRLHKGRQPGR